MSFEFDEKANRVFKDLAGAMQSCTGSWVQLFVSAGLVLAVTILTATDPGKLRSTVLSTLSDLVNSAVMVLLLRDAARRFELIVSTEGRDIPLLFTGVQALRSMFQQAAFITIALGGASSVAQVRD